MSSSTHAGAPLASRSSILRGTDAVQLRPARIDSDLRTSPYLTGLRADPRLVDPSMTRAFDEIAVAVKEKARTVGYKEGYEEGLALGYNEAGRLRVADQEAFEERERVRTAKLQGALDVLAAAAEHLEQRQTLALADVEDVVLRTAFEVAEAIISRELALAADPARDAVNRAFALLPIAEDVVLHLNPADIDALAAAHDWQQGRTVQLVADTSLARGDCVADAGPRRVDARISAALERVRAVMAP